MIKMRKIFVLVTSLVMLLPVLFGCSSKTDTDEKEVMVFAAASLKDVLEEIDKAFQAEGNDSKVTFVFESSGTLQKQIAEGAPCDIFVSAAKSNMDALEKDDIIAVDTRKDLLSNQLTLIVSKESKQSVNTVNDLLAGNISKVAIGETATVPAGKYAKESLENLKLWQDLEGKFVLCNNVRQVLTYVENGDAECGFVYKTDALIMNKDCKMIAMPADSYGEIVYPAAIMVDSKDNEEVKAFYQFLSSDKAKNIFEQFGFVVK